VSKILRRFGKARVARTGEAATALPVVEGDPYPVEPDKRRAVRDRAVVAEMLNKDAE
jgi:hypothetical protein